MRAVAETPRQVEIKPLEQEVEENLAEIEKCKIEW